MQIHCTANNIHKSKHIFTLLICFICTCLGSYGKYFLSSWIFIAEFLQTKFLTFKHQQMKFMRKVLKKLPSQHWWGRMVSVSLNASVQKSLQDVFYMWIYFLFSVIEYFNIQHNYLRYLTLPFSHRICIWTDKQWKDLHNAWYHRECCRWYF